MFYNTNVRKVGQDENNVMYIRKRRNESGINDKDSVSSQSKRLRSHSEASSLKISALGDWFGWMKEKARHAPIISHICDAMSGTKLAGDDDSDSDCQVEEPETKPRVKNRRDSHKETKSGTYFSLDTSELGREPIHLSRKVVSQTKWESLKKGIAIDVSDENKAPSGINGDKSLRKLPLENKCLEISFPKKKNGKSKMKQSPKKKISNQAFWKQPINKMRGITAGESIRLEEKECYRMLLEQNQRGKEGLNAASYISRSGNSIEKDRHFKSPSFSKINLPPKSQKALIGRLKDKSMPVQALHCPPWDVKHTDAKNVLHSERSIRTLQHIVSKSSDSDDDAPVMVAEIVHHRRSFRNFGKKAGPSSYSLSPPSTSARPNFDPVIIEDDDEEEVKILEEKFRKRDRINSIGQPSQDAQSVCQLEISPQGRHSPLNSSIFCSKWIQELKQSVEYDCKEQSKKIREQEEIKIALHDKIFQDLHQRSVTLSDESDSEDDLLQFPEITTEMSLRIEDALRPTPHYDILSRGFGLQITRRDMETLSGLNWLNDEIINFYTNMLVERGKLDNYPRCFAFNTFFYPKLISHGHTALKRWTRKEDIFSYDLILIPVHLGVHWCLAVIDFRQKKIQYYDSMGGHNNECLNGIRTYLQDESLDKRKKEYDVSDWTLESVKNIPQQMNGCDCGMFALKYAEYITRNAKITFTQQHMPYFRRRMVYEIVTNKLL